MSGAALRTTVVLSGTGDLAVVCGFVRGGCCLCVCLLCLCPIYLFAGLFNQLLLLVRIGTDLVWWCWRRIWWFYPLWVVFSGGSLPSVFFSPWEGRRLGVDVFSRGFPAMIFHRLNVSQSLSCAGLVLHVLFVGQ
jgi:hypothetical protein